MSIQGSNHPFPRFLRIGTFFEQACKSLPADGKPTLNAKSFDGSKIDRHYARALVEYAAKYTRGPEVKADSDPISLLPNGMVTVGELALGKAVFDILTAKIDTSTPRGMARERIRREFGLRTELDRKTFSYLSKAYGPKHLDGTHVVYNGHATGATISLFPMLRALGLRSGGVRRANYSGDKGAAPLINTIISELTRKKGKDFNLAAQPVDAMWDELRTPGVVVLLNGATMMLNATKNGPMPADIRARVERGEIRFVLHNAADLEAFEKLAFQRAIALDLARSKPKEMETEVIGQQLVQHAEEGSARLNACRLQDSKVFVIGHGLIGQAITKALIEQHVPRQNIIVIDTNGDPNCSAVRAAKARYLDIHTSIPDGFSKEENGFVFVATNSARGLDASHLPKLPRHLLVENANSGGIGVDVDSIFGKRDANGKRRGPYRNAQRFDFFEGAHGIKTGENPVFSDMVATRLPEDAEDLPNCFTLMNVAEIPCTNPVTGETTMELRVLAPNLTDTVGQSRLDTSSMLAAAACIIKNLNRPLPAGQVYEFPKEEEQVLYLSSLRPLADDCAI